MPSMGDGIRAADSKELSSDRVGEGDEGLWGTTTLSGWVRGPSALGTDGGDSPRPKEMADARPDLAELIAWRPGRDRGIGGDRETSGDPERCASGGGEGCM